MPSVQNISLLFSWSVIYLHIHNAFIGCERQVGQASYFAVNKSLICISSQNGRWGPASVASYDEPPLDAKWPKSVIRLVTSDDLDLRKGHLWLRPESCRFIGCLVLMRLFSAFFGGKTLNGNVTFVFDLTCDVTGDPGNKFFNFIWKISSRLLYCRLNFSVTSIGYRDRWGGGEGATAPQQRAGIGLGPAGRGLTAWAASIIYHIL